MDTIDDIDLLTVAEVLARCRIGRTFLYEEIKSGRLRRLKIGRLTRFRADDVAHWIRSRDSEVTSALSANLIGDRTEASVGG